MSKEECYECGEYTGNAGRLDDSLYLEDGTGPMCQRCYYHYHCEELEVMYNMIEGEVGMRRKEATDKNKVIKALQAENEKYKDLYTTYMKRNHVLKEALEQEKAENDQLRGLILVNFREGVPFVGSVYSGERLSRRGEQYLCNALNSFQAIRRYIFDYDKENAEGKVSK